jgi:hypothetical protein
MWATVLPSFAADIAARMRATPSAAFLRIIKYPLRINVLA